MDDLDFSNEEREELSYAEIYSMATLNGEVVITIPKEELERVKNGLKNFKAKQTAKMKEDGLLPDTSTYTFTVRDPFDKEFDKELFCDLSIQLNRKSTIKVAAIRIPDGDI